MSKCNTIRPQHFVETFRMMSRVLETYPRSQYNNGQNGDFFCHIIIVNTVSLMTLSLGHARWSVQELL